MKDGNGLRVISPTTGHTSPSGTKREASDSGAIGKGRYKIGALAAVLLLAMWSMFTGTVTLRSSAGSLKYFADEFSAPIRDDLDILETEEREKLVKHMWDVYTSSPRIRLPQFWQEAFEAAYEDLISDAPGVRDAAISEIAKMSLRTVVLEPEPLESSSMHELNLKQAVKGNAGVI